MARIRTIKPEFWTDEKIVQLPFEARLIFIGMWNFCDDEGYLWHEPDRIRMQVLPNDDIDIDAIIDLLSASGFIDVYIDEDDKRYIKIVHFSDHQKVDHPSKTKIAREGSRKISIPANVRRAVAKKYGCPQGETIAAECYYCGSHGEIVWWRTTKGKPSSWVSFSKLELDHLEPESMGGETTNENIILSCRECNRSKKNKDIFAFLVNSREVSRGLPQEGKGRERNGIVREGNIKTHTPNTVPNSNQEKPTPSPAALVCLELRKFGFGEVNQAHPLLLELLKAGATTEEFIFAATEAKKRNKDFKYLLGIVKGQRKEAMEASKQILHGELPNKSPPANGSSKFKKFDSADYNRGNDGYGNPRRNNVIDVEGVVVNEVPAIQGKIAD